MEAFYTFKVIPGRVNMTYTGRMYIEWSSGFPPGLNNDNRKLFCSINSTKVDCERYGDRKIIIKP
jgi:hypothetical protein